jgi:tripartite ATP-independent transporter DctM subunit
VSYWERTETFLDKINVFARWCSIVGIAILVPLIFGTFVDVVLRYCFNRPIAGLVEIAEPAVVAVVFLIVAWTTAEKGHVKVDIVTRYLSHKNLLTLELMTTVLSAGLVAVMAWQAVEGVRYCLQFNFMHGSVLSLPVAPFYGIEALGLATTFFILVRDILKKLSEAIKCNFTWHRWLGSSALLVAFIAVATWAIMAHWQLSLATVGSIGIVIFVLLLLTGMPVSFVLILTSLVFLSNIRGLDIGLATVRSQMFDSLAQYSWTAAMSFVVAGFLCFAARFGEDLFTSAYRWIGRIPGGLATGTILGSAGFAAIVGEPMSPTATMSSVAVPQMRRRRYSEALIAGAIVTGASLGPVIPPSIPFIIYGTLSGVPVGNLFLGGLIAGLIMVVTLNLSIYLWCRFRPEAGPRGERFTLREKLGSLPTAGPVAFIFLAIILGIYQGVLTPSEGGAIASVMALLLGVILRRFSWQSIIQAFQKAGRVIGMVFFVVIGASIFTRFLAWSNFSDMATGFFTGLSVSPTILCGIILVIFLFLGCFLDTLTLLLIGVPIFHPIAVVSGVNPVWFAVLFSLVINIGVITPPVGLNLFILQASTDIDLPDIYRGALALLPPLVASVVLVFAVPAILSWVM